MKKFYTMLEACQKCCSVHVIKNLKVQVGKEIFIALPVVIIGCKYFR
jgi:carbonic anhydrase/acetyltransferase-like protein (isoleucine patch superfamily)